LEIVDYHPDPGLVATHCPAQKLPSGKTLLIIH